MLAASPGVFGLARYAILDTLFTLFLFGGAALLAVAALRDRPALAVARLCARLRFGRADQGTARAGAVRADAGARRSRCRPICGAALARAALGARRARSCSSSRRRGSSTCTCDSATTSSTATSSTKTSASSRQPVREPARFWFYFQILARRPAAVDGAARSDGWSTMSARGGAASRSTASRCCSGPGRSPSSASSRCRPSSSITTCFRRRRRCACCARAPGRMPRQEPRQPRHAGSRARRVGRWSAARRPRRRPRLLSVARLDLPPAAMIVPVALTLAGLAMVATVVVRGAVAAGTVAGDRRADGDLRRPHALRDAGARAAEGRRRRGGVGGRRKRGPDDRHRELSAQSVEPGIPLLRRAATSSSSRIRTRPRRSSRRRSRSSASCGATRYDEFVATGVQLRRRLRARRDVGDVGPRALAHLHIRSSRFVVVPAAA